MKNIWFSSLFILFCLEPALAQNRIGIVGGGLYAKSNLTNQNESRVLSQSSTTFGNIYSFYGGLAYDIKVTNEFSIRSKLLYINKGWTETKDLKRYAVDTINPTSLQTVNIPIEAVKSKETYTLGYLELPVHFTFYTPLGKSLLSFGVGPYLSLGVSGRYNYKALNSRKILKEYFTTSDTSVQTIIRTIGRPSGTTYDTVIITEVSTINQAVTRDTSNYLHNSSAAIGFESSKKAIYTAYKFDYGASLEASLMFRNGLSVNAAYTFGFNNVITERYGVLQNRHRSIMVGIAYYMKRLRKSK